MSRPLLHRLSASEVVKLTRSGELTVVEYVTALAERIKLRDPVVRAWAFFDVELALESAKALDAIPPKERGALHGVCVGVKDMMLTKDMPTEHFSAIWKGHRPNLDADFVHTLRSAGALMLGKTHTTEFANVMKGTPAANPHDSARTPGGSSSGSAAAVADFQCPLALGTQTVGSTIRPASFNGIFSFKPTWNAISREGVKFASVTLDTVGFFSRSPEDFDLVASVFRLLDDKSPMPTPLANCKFAFVRTSVWPQAQPEAVEAFTHGAELLRSAGAEVEEIELPEAFADIAKWHARVLAAESHSSFLSHYYTSKHLLDPTLVAYVENYPNTSRAELLEAYDGVARLRPVIDEIASRYTALVTPSATGEAPVMEEPMRFTGVGAFNAMWTILHNPVINVPGFRGPNGMPVGLTLVGARYHDQALIEVAKVVGPMWQQGGFVSQLG